MSNEHVWPRWVSRALKERMGLDKSARSFVDLSRKTRRPTELINIKAPICEACNSRWLSTFENDAQAVLEPLVTGRPRPLTWQEQMIVAKWAVKTALMVDLSSGSEAIIPVGFYREFAQKRAPLPSMAVWIAGYQGPRPAMAIRKALWIDVPQTEHPNAFVTTIVAGGLVLQVAGHFVVSGSFKDDRWQFADAVRLIWPVIQGPIAWPPGHTALDDDALSDFAASFTDRPKNEDPSSLPACDER